MIAKVTQGASGRALILYLFGPGRANEHTDQRVITSGIVMGVEEGRTLNAAEVSDLGAALDAANDTYRAHPAGGHHLSLSLPAGDDHLSDEQWAEIAQRPVRAIGFEREEDEPAAWVASVTARVQRGTSTSTSRLLWSEWTAAGWTSGSPSEPSPVYAADHSDGHDLRDGARTQWRPDRHCCSASFGHYGPYYLGVGTAGGLLHVTQRHHREHAPSGGSQGRGLSIGAIHRPTNSPALAMCIWP
jgi:hypothetical protein